MSDSEYYQALKQQPETFSMSEKRTPPSRAKLAIYMVAACSIAALLLACAVLAAFIMHARHSSLELERLRNQIQTVQVRDYILYNDYIVFV